MILKPVRGHGARSGIIKTKLPKNPKNLKHLKNPNSLNNYAK